MAHGGDDGGACGGACGGCKTRNKVISATGTLNGTIIVCYIIASHCAIYNHVKYYYYTIALYCATS